MIGLLPLFLVSLAAMGVEIALTRFFAVAGWSEYGYWVISIVMAGFALSGVATALGRVWLERHRVRLLAILPAALILTAAGGYELAARNPFNPLQLQNPVTLWPQIALIGLYYLELLPFFFLTGIAISLFFIDRRWKTNRVYAYDLAGAGCGALAVLALMLVLHPFRLVAALLLPLAAMALFQAPGQLRRRAVIGAVLALVVSEALLLGWDASAYSQFKPIYAPLHTPGARVVRESLSPRGVFTLLDDFTERVDTDLSNDSAMLKLPGPPRTLGLYRDGVRIAAPPRGETLDARYASGTLGAAPFLLFHDPRVLLIGNAGGWSVAEAQAMGAGSILADEPDPMLRGPAMAAPGLAYTGRSPLAALRDAPPGGFDLIDIADGFLAADPANTVAFTTAAVASGFRALSTDGVLSIPVSIRDFPVYALRMLATVRAGLAEHVADPSAHVLVYRSAWTVRILVSRQVWSKARIDAIRKYCDDRSFDVSFYPGMDVGAARATIYNDLPAISFAAGAVETGGDADDSIADEAGAILTGHPSASSRDFDLRPETLDRPPFFNILRLDQLGTVLKRLEILPQQELGPLINLAVLSQALVIAIVVMLLPLAARRRIGAKGPLLRRSLVYFPALGLGYLFIEIALIGEATIYLNDATTAFALVLSGMLLFSGLGSMALPTGRSAIRIWPVALLLILCLSLLPMLMSATIGLPHALRVVLFLLAVAAVSLPLGMPFPAGLAAVSEEGRGFLPWAWALNGAFSVIATPIANLVATEIGFRTLIMAGFALYVIAYLAFPALGRLHQAARGDLPGAGAKGAPRHLGT